MKKSELQIGNWVMLDYNFIYSDEMKKYKPDFRPYQIKSGADIDMVGLKNPNGDDVFQPITITEDIVTNIFGFRLDEMWEKCHDIPKTWFGLQSRVSMTNDTKFMNSLCGWFVRLESCDMSTIGSMELDYVHQLQNLISITDIEFYPIFRD